MPHLNFLCYYLSMKIAILIPTYNEADIIEELLRAVIAETTKISHHSFSITVIDGKSTDETVLKVKKVHEVHCVIEERRGLGRAYVRGIDYALHNLQADAFMEFDGDYQHDPKDIVTLIQKLDEGYDYIIGSRYVSGGTVPDEWPWYRKWLSRAGSAIISFVLRLPIADSTSGFKLTRSSFYTPVHMISFHHAYKIQLLYTMIKTGAKTTEVPIHFLHRHKGVSKISSKDFFESCRVLMHLFVFDRIS